MNKVIMNSLPTREKPCVDELYLKCLARKVNEIAQDQFHCNLQPLLPPNNAKESCPNNVARYILELWSNAIASLDKFEDCLNIQPCSQVIYSTRTHTENVKVHPGDNQGPEGHPKPPHGRSPFQINGDSESIIYLTFENDLVQVIEDQYIYSFMGIFSEIGGAVGILVGMSIMTIVEYLLMLHKKAAMLTHFQEASNVVQHMEPNSNRNDSISMNDNRLKRTTEEFQVDEQNKKAKTFGDTIKTNFSVSRRSSMISTFSNKFGPIENME